MKMKKILSVVLAMAMVTLSLSACGEKAPDASASGDTAKTDEAAPADDSQDAAADSSDSSGGSGEGLTFGVTVCMITGYYSAMVDAIEATAKEKGIETVLLVAENDTTKQNQQMENLIAQQVDAIICNPEDGTAIAASVQKAMDAGIPVVMVDRMVEGAEPSKQIINDSYELAKELVTSFVDSENAKNLEAPLKTLVMVGSMADSYAVNCLTAHREVIEANPEIFELIAEIPGDWNQDTALKGIQNALSSNPDIDLIITPSDMYLPPIKSALEQVGRWKERGEDGHVMILSMDGDSYGLQCIKDGYSEADAVVDAAACGSWGVDYALKLVNGEEKSDGEVVNFPGFIVSYDNFDETAPNAYSFSELK